MTEWSVGLEAEGDRVFEREEVVALADAVAGHGGIATGIGTTRYGAQLLVQAESEDEAVKAARSRFVDAARTAGLPECPIVRVEVEEQ
jgi:hypothetical protein